MHHMAQRLFGELQFGVIWHNSHYRVKWLYLKSELQDGKFELKQINWSHENGSNKPTYYQVISRGQEKYVIY